MGILPEGYPCQSLQPMGIFIPILGMCGLRQLWLCQISGQAKAFIHGLALAQVIAFICKNILYSTRL